MSFIQSLLKVARLANIEKIDGLKNQQHVGEESAPAEGGTGSGLPDQALTRAGLEKITGGFWATGGILNRVAAAPAPKGNTSEIDVIGLTLSPAEFVDRVFENGPSLGQLEESLA